MTSYLQSSGAPRPSFTPVRWKWPEYIYAGEIFQVVLAQRFDLELGAEPLDLYRSLRQVNPSPYMYLLQYPELAVVGSSPEPMVRVRDGVVISRPIAGTRRRGHTEADDRRLAAELSEHPKERAEHVMLVDLARNDVGKVVEFGSETVDELMTLERYSHVMHLTSQVSGRLRPGLGPVDVLRATLPAGTVSGAPKVRAMQIIDELEPARRGPYAGVVGYIDFSGNVDTAIAIRTMLVGADGRASVEAGAGIVADSIADTEDLECRNKAAALLAAVPGARRSPLLAAGLTPAGAILAREAMVPGPGGRPLGHRSRGELRPGGAHDWRRRVPCPSWRAGRATAPTRCCAGGCRRGELSPGPDEPGHCQAGTGGVDLGAGLAAPGQAGRVRAGQQSGTDGVLPRHRRWRGCSAGGQVAALQAAHES